jgi:putative endonuclease
MTEQKRRGNVGEKAAAAYLESTGFTILKRQYHTRYGEVDLICENSRFLIFVEVKARREGSMLLPREAVTPAKQAKIKKAASEYLTQAVHTLQPRFDVIEVTLAATSVQVMAINHIENAF